METMKKLQETERYRSATKKTLSGLLFITLVPHYFRSLSNAEDERDNVKEMNDKLNEQILELANKFEKESEELQNCKKKLQEVDILQQRLEQEAQNRQAILREAQEKETILLAQVRCSSCLTFFINRPKLYS